MSRKRNLDYSQQNLQGKDFRKKNLERTNFWLSDLTNACFDFAILAYADLGATKLNGASFRESNLIGVQIPSDIANVNFEKANLYCANGRSTHWVRLNLREINAVSLYIPDLHIEGSDLTDAYLYECNAVCAKFTYCNCTGIDLRYGNLDSAIFAGCDLRDADFTGANLKKAQFINCNLGGAQLVTPSAGDAIFKGCTRIHA